MKTISFVTLFVLLAFVSNAAVITKSPTTYTNNGGDDSFGTGNISSANGVGECVDLDKDDDAKGYFRGFDFSAIPAGAIVTQISVTIVAKWSSNGARDEVKFRIENGNGEDFKFLDNKTEFSTAYGTHTSTSAVAGGDIFGIDVATEWESTDLQSAGFGIRVEDVESKSNGAQFCIDYIAVSVTYGSACDPCFSIASGDWSTVANWSETSGGVATGSIPPSGTGNFIIERGYTIDFNADYAVDSLIVGTAAGSGILRFTGDHDLDFDNDAQGANSLLYVASGSSIIKNGNNNAKIRFVGQNDTYVVTVLDNTVGIDIGDIELRDDDMNVTIDGATGRIAVFDEFVFAEDNCTVTNNMVGTISIGDELRFGNGNDDDNIFTNNGTITVTDRMLFDADADDCGYVGGTGSSLTVGNDIEFESEDGDTRDYITNDGTISVTDDILVYQGDVTITNTANGVFTVGDDIFQDNDDSDFDFVNSGTFTVTDDIRMNSNDMSADYLNNVGGTFNFADCEASNGDLDIENSGTINQSGTFLGGEIDGDSEFYNYANARWNYAGTGHDLSTDMRCGTAYTNNVFNYNRNGSDQGMIDVQNNEYYHLEITNSNDKISVDQIDIEGNLTISGTATLTVDAGNDDITIAGNWINTSSGGFAEGTEDVTFDGSGAQSITCSNIGTETFYNLFINKTAGGTVTQNNHVAVSNILNFNGTNGYIALNTNDLTITNWDNGDITGYDTDEFIIVDQTGFIKYTGVAAGEVLNAPMGLAAGATNYALADLTMTNAGGGTLDANLCPTISKTGATCGGVAETDSVVTFTWNFVSTSTDATIKLTWDASKELTTFDRTLSSVCHYNGTDWENLTAYGAAVSEGGTLYSRTGNTTGFSPFGVQMSGSPLPIELLSYSASVEGSNVVISWVTGAEINNDYFILEKSTNGKDFVKIAVVKGAGNSFDVLNYQTIDKNSANGINYYRLSQTDYNGKSESFGIVLVDYGSHLNETNENQTDEVIPISAIVYPNPVRKGDQLFLNIENKLESKEVLVILLNSVGQQLYSKLVVSEVGSTLVDIDFSENVSPGLYLIIGSSDNLLFQKKLMVR